MSSNQQLLLGEGAGSAPAVFVEDVFSTYLYTGTGSGSGTPGTIATITNNVDLSTKGGLVWIKNRGRVTDHGLYDTARGALNGLQSNGTGAQSAFTNTLTAFTTSGFSLGNDGSNTVNLSGDTYCSWTFRKQPKFFDIVTYTGDGVGGREIPHALGGTIGAVIIKCTSLAVDWVMWHRSESLKFGVLNTTAEFTTTDAPFRFGNNSIAIDPTNSVITVGGSNKVNSSGATYVAYIFAHNAGGFGLAGTDNVISCGSYTGTGAVGNTITVGYEPQWVMIKASSGTSAAYQDWYIYDVMRGMPVGDAINDNRLMANLSSAEASYPEIGPTATGFVCEATGARLNESGTTFIYIAIRRGPMKVPTVGTSVFSPLVLTNATGTQNTTGFVVDSQWINYTPGLAINTAFNDRLRGVSTTSTSAGRYLVSSSTAAESTASNVTQGWNNTGFQTTPYFAFSTSIYFNFARAPGFFDEVCYTGTGSNTTQTHNLGVSPELVIVKARSDAGTNWLVYPSTTSFGNALYLNTTTAFIGSGPVSALSSTTVTFNYHGNPSYSASTSAVTYVAYLFATCAGVSKVGSYTGNGSSQTIACGFTAGSRFVMIKRTDSTGDWYVWDSARGIVAGNDPHLSLNTTAAEVTTDDSVDTDNSGFIVNQDAATNVNVTSATYIFLAIA